MLESAWVYRSGKWSEEIVELDQDRLLSILENISVQMRNKLSQINIVSHSLVTKEMREDNAAMDQRMANLDQTWYQLLRMVENIDELKHLLNQEILNGQSVDLVAFLAEICEKTQSAMGGQGAEITFVCKHPVLMWDVNQSAMERLVYHLLSNSLKFTEKSGKITVELVQKKASTVELSVKDTGCGMTAEQIEQTLDLGRHVIAYHEHQGGVGLGLPLCQAVVKQHHGQLTIVSKVSGKKNRGTKVTVQLPKNTTMVVSLRDVQSNYVPSFHPVLMHLADALPSAAYCIRQQD